VNGEKKREERNKLCGLRLPYQNSLWINRPLTKKKSDYFSLPQIADRDCFFIHRNADSPGGTKGQENGSGGGGRRRVSSKKGSGRGIGGISSSSGGVSLCPVVVISGVSHCILMTQSESRMAGTQASRVAHVHTAECEGIHSPGGIVYI
jgi:hypothetical protein